MIDSNTYLSPEVSEMTMTSFQLMSGSQLGGDTDSFIVEDNEIW